jgi:hypothetical protein
VFWDRIRVLAEAEQQLIQPKREFLTTAGPWAETLSKAVAGIVIALYASGFLIISIYHSKYGFVGTNPFRPRILAAGAWFFLFTAIPTSIALRYRTEPWSRIARNAFFLWIGSCSLSLPLGNLLFDFPPNPNYLPPGKWGWAVSLFGLAAMILLQVSVKKKTAPQWIVATLSVSLALYSVSFSVRNVFTYHQFDFSTLALWFFATTLAVKLEFEVRTGRNLAEDGEWSKPLVLLFGLLLIFSRELYPHLKASWGGGTPANVTIYFSRDSLLSPNRSVQAQLIEESDEGFYIVGPKELKAIFVPRSSVAMIYFSDKPADSPMLQNNE